MEGLRRLVVLQPLKYGTIDHNLKFEDEIINEAVEFFTAIQGGERELFVSSAPTPDKSYVRGGMREATLRSHVSEDDRESRPKPQSRRRPRLSTEMINQDEMSRPPAPALSTPPRHPPH